MERELLIPGRLEDVLALIQILGLIDNQEGTSESGPIVRTYQEPKSETQRKSDKRWSDVAERHPEFFRVAGEGRAMSLISRFVTKGRPPASPETVKTLMALAVDLYDRQARQEADEHERRARHNAQKIQIASLVFAGLASLASFITVLLSFRIAL
jgi:hypothetical protein